MAPNLISYGMDFASFLIQKTRFKDEIKNIILFGSVSRQEEEKDSDVDIFVDIVKEEPKIEKEIRNILEQFLDSTKYKNYWSLLGVKNEVKLSIGTLSKWKELIPSVVSNGIVLYGKFKLNKIDGKYKAFFVWENIKPNSKRVLFNKQMFGHKYGKKFYPGLLQKYGGERLGKGCVIVDLEHSLVFHKLFKLHKIQVKIKKILEY